MNLILQDVCSILYKYARTTCYIVGMLKERITTADFGKITGIIAYYFSEPGLGADGLSAYVYNEWQVRFCSITATR